MVTITRDEARVIATAMMLTDELVYRELVVYRDLLVGNVKHFDLVTIYYRQLAIIHGEVPKILRRMGFPDDQVSCRLVHEYIREDRHDKS